MSSKKANSTNNLATKPAVPARFRCKVGGEWRPLASFSQNQQRMIQRQMDSRRQIDAAHSGMTCRDHTSGARTEIQCELCGITKHADEYSQSSRRNGIYHCKRCVAWIETQEPEVTPTPLETGHISVEEERGEMWQTRFVDSTDFFADDIMPQAPITAMSSLGLEDLETSSGIDLKALISKTATANTGSLDERSTASAAPPSHKSLPPHLKKKAMETGGRGDDDRPSSSATTLSAKSTGTKLPPHLRAKMKSSVASDGGSEPSNSDMPPGSVSTATTVREEHSGGKHRRVSFNAWDHSGNQHRDVKSSTTNTSTQSSSAAPSDADVSSDDLEDGPPWKQPALRKNSKWVKSSEMRLSQTELRRQLANHHVAARHIEPAIERQRQHNAVKFCEPDDEDDDIYDS